MSFELNLQTIGVLAAAADLSAKQFYAVKLASTGKYALCDTAGERVSGILQNKPVADEAATVAVAGVTKALAGGVIAAGDLVSTDANGKVVSASQSLLTATAALNFSSIAAGLSADLTITVTGAAVGDAVAVGTPAAPDAGMTFFGFVSATNTVTIRAVNNTAGAVDLASGTYRATVVKPTQYVLGRALQASAADGNVIAVELFQDANV